ncbi:hypothetical protein ACO0LM_00745 [Undibacterium sp. Di26W]|uniref:hypothetical protein n=1 Tax=Undibacterium sp. Di26W TaxID=3413035 RepID=UPI003BF03C31
MFGTYTRPIGVIVVAISALLLTNPAAAEPALKMSTQCTALVFDGKTDNAPAAAKFKHQYMLLIIFKKGKGSQYFGNPNIGEYGCIPDVEANQFPPVPTNTFIIAENCPNDCVYPRDTRAPLNDGKDPLGKNPWGIVSAINSEKRDGGPGRLIEVWELAVRDKCHAEALYASFTLPNGLLLPALERGHMLGEIVVGYDRPSKDPELASAECFKK